MPTARGDIIAVSPGTPLRLVEREVILATLAQTNQNKTRTAHVLGISPKTLYNKLRAYGLGGISPTRGARSSFQSGNGSSSDGNGASSRP
jgi:DNA-binding NtrC family response regulator